MSAQIQNHLDNINEFIEIEMTQKHVFHGLLKRKISFFEIYEWPTHL